MASIPTWFDVDYYMASKLAQMQKTDPEGNWTAETLKAAFDENGFTGAEGIYAHYDKYSLAEGTNPSQYVNQAVYLTAKMEQMQKAEPDAGWTMDKIIAAFKDAGLTVGEHYDAFGVKEGINPSNDFDNAKYMADKLAQLQKDDPKGEWTAEKVQAAFDKEGLSPLDHYLLYGKDEGLTVKPVDDPIHPYNPGKEFALTTKVDTITGTDADDTITGVASSLSSEGTLNAGDQIDGGEGLDTLKVDMKAGFTGFTGDGKMVNVENVELTNSGSIDRTFSAKNITGVDTYTLKDTGAAINLSDVAAAGITVNVEGLKSGNTTIGFTADAVKGTADALTLGLNKVGTVEVKDATGKITTAEAPVNVTAAGIENLTVVATDANVVNLANAATESITAKGAGSLDVKAVAATVKSFDASAMTGAVKADLTNVTSLSAVKGGAGDDTFTVTSLATTATIDGGAGNDTLVLKNVSGTLQPTMSGFENVTVDGSAGLTISGKNIKDFNALTVKGNSTVTLANVEAPDFTVNASGVTTSTVTLASATKLTYNSVASATTVAAKGSDAVSMGIHASEATSATINVGANTAVSGDINLAKAADVTLNVASALGGADGKAEQTSFAGTINAAKASSLVVKAEGLLGGGAAFNVAEATSVNINAAKGGSAAVAAAKATSVDVTAGDAMALTGTFSSAETVTLTQNKGALTGGVNFDKIHTLTVSGSDNTSAVTLGTLGNGQDYGITVNASGLKGGLTFGAVTTLGAVELNLADVTGIVTDAAAISGSSVTVNAALLGKTSLHDITATTTDVTVNAKGILGGNAANPALTLGDIAANKGAVNIQFDGSSDVTIGTITGKTVNLDASEYLGAVAASHNVATDATIGAITADTAVIKGSSLFANTFSTITTDNLTYTGGIAADTLTIADAATTAGLKLSIDTGAGDDSVTITAATGKMTGTIANAETVSITGTDGGLDMSGLTITGNTAANTTITGGAGADILKAAVGGGTITGGAGADKISLGAGADKVVYTDLTDSLVAAHDSITGFLSGTDKFVVASAQQSAIAGAGGLITKTIASSDNLSTDLTSNLSTGMVVNGAAVVTISAGSAAGVYLVLNDDTVAFDASTDAVIKLAGIDSIHANDFVAAN